MNVGPFGPAFFFAHWSANWIAILAVVQVAPTEQLTTVKFGNQLGWELNA
jgi:hypothetical protein